MSGSSYDYAYFRIGEVASDIRESAKSVDDPDQKALRLRFANHLDLVSRAMHDIEWVDSCDYGPGDEVEAIRKVLGGLTLDDLHNGMLHTYQSSGNTAHDVYHMAAGLAEEAGEALGKLKRHFREDRGVFTEERVEQILSEVGDCAWYCAGLAHALGSNIEKVASKTLAKLADRKARGVLKGSGDNR